MDDVRWSETYGRTLSNQCRNIVLCICEHNDSRLLEPFVDHETLWPYRAYLVRVRLLGLGFELGLGLGLGLGLAITCAALVTCVTWLSAKITYG